MACPLCELEPLTKQHAENDLAVCVDCLTCGVPMVVLKRHTMEATAAEKVAMYALASSVCKSQGVVLAIRTEQRQIKDHLHWHLEGAMKTLVYSVVFGGVDSLQPPKHMDDENTDYVVFVDQQDISAPPPWRQIHIGMGPTDNPYVEMKRFKMLAHPEFVSLLQGYDRSIWMDGNVHLLKSTAALFSRMDDAQMMLGAHGTRDCAWEEVHACHRLGGRRAEHVRDAVELLERTNHPRGCGLWDCGLICRYHTNGVLKFNRDWFRLCQDWTWRDQIALPVALRLLRKEGSFILHSVRTSLIFRRHNHIMCQV